MHWDNEHKYMWNHAGTVLLISITFNKPPHQQVYEIEQTRHKHYINPCILENIKHNKNWTWSESVLLNNKMVLEVEIQIHIQLKFKYDGWFCILQIFDNRMKTRS